MFRFVSFPDSPGLQVASALAILVLSCASAGAGEVVVVDCVTHVRNPAAPPAGVEVLDLEELWRVGGADDEATLFGLVTRVLADETGRLYVLDSQLQQVSVYSPDGALERIIFGEGDGPGELRRATDLVFMTDGSLGAVNRFPGAVINVSADGTPAGPALMPPEPGHMFSAAVCRAGQLIMASTVNIPDEETGTHVVSSRLASVDAAGDQQVLFLESDRHVDYQNDYVFDEKAGLADFLYSFDVGPDGRIFAQADRDVYAIAVYEPDGRPSMVIERVFTPAPRTPVETARIKAMLDRRFRTFPFSLRYELCDTEAVIAWYHRGLQVTGDGELWIRHGLSAEIGQAHGALLAFDVFDAAGHFQRQVAVPAAGNPLYDGVFRVGDDLLVVVHGFVDAMRTMVGGGQGGLEDEYGEPEPIEIVCYRIRS